MTVLVTGAAGFLGRHVMAALAAEGRPARGLDIRPWSGCPGGLSLASVTDPAAVADAVAGAGAVIHLAAHTSLWARDPAVFERVNITGTANVAGAAARAGVRRFLHVSSATTLVGGRPRGATLSEADDPAEPIGGYARSKRAAERLVLAEAGLDASVLLPTLPLGPGDVSMTAPTRLVDTLRGGGPPAILETWLDFVDVRDLAATIVCALDRAAPGARYLVGGHGLPLSALALQVDRLAGRTPRPRPRVPVGVARLAALADEAAARLTGREPQATAAGVAIAARAPRFASGRAVDELGHAVRPLEGTLIDTLGWLATR